MDIEYNHFSTEATNRKISETNTMSITYNYPLTFATKLQPSYTGYIHYSFPGKENEPNLTFQSQPNVTTSFISKDLYIFSKIHNFPDMPFFDGELVIKHSPITNGDKPFYMCFPLLSTDSAPKNEIYDLFTNENFKNVEINIMNVLQNTSLDATMAYYYETPYAAIAVSQNPIQVPVSFIGFNRGKINDLWEPPQNLIIVKMNQIKTKTKEDNNAHPLSWIDNIPIVKPPIREGWKDSICDGSYCYFDCDYVDAGYENEVPTYMIPAGSDKITIKEKAVNNAMTAIWFILILILTVWLGPLLFSIIASRLLKINDSSDQKIIKLDNIEGGIGQLLLIPAIVLIFVGVPKNLNCGPKDEACMKAANDMITPGIIMLAIWICYAGALFINKLYIPNFLGFRDPTRQIDPYYLYKPGDIHIYQHFYPKSLFMTLVYPFV